MDIQPIVIGTAGHIDHGKSTLVRALTGVDPDRLKEERERGMTIDLGFAPLELADGRLVGIVDVPGHERFVRNMVAGASGIDLVVLVVAADDGVMPQTREHLQIMELLGVGRGLVALTKVDLVEDELVELAEEDVRETLRGTFLEDAPLVRVSAVEGRGLDELRERLFAMAAGTPPRSAEGVFRMPVQRVFSKAGFGTVVTGIPQSGSACLGDVLEVVPAGKRGKVRGLNAYRHATERVRSGHSSAINLTDVGLGDVRRGDVVATPGFFAPQRMVAGRMTALPDLERPIANRTPVRLHTGTADPHGEVVLLDVDELAPGGSALVQFRLEEPVVCAPGDRFVVRLLSPVVTLGGGAILEESRHRLKRFKRFVIEGLSRREEALTTPRAVLDAALEGRGALFSSAEELAVELKRDPAEVRGWLEELALEGRAVSPREGRWMHAGAERAARAKLSAAVDAWFEEHPHRSLVDVLELRRRTGFDQAICAALVEAEAAAGSLEAIAGGKLRRSGRAPRLSAKLAELVGPVAERLRAARFQPPTPEELGASLGVAPETLERALEHLVDEQVLVRVGGELYLEREAWQAARDAVVENCARHGHLEIPELRDALGTTRKFLIPLLEAFDAQGLTMRQGAHRVLKRRRD